MKKTLVVIVFVWAVLSMQAGNHNYIEGLKLRDRSMLLNIDLSKKKENSTIFNKGIGGNSTVNILKRIDHDVLDLHPDLVILMVGTNDMLNSRKMLSYEQYSENLNEIVKKIRDKGSQVLMVSPPPVDSAYLFNRHDKSLYKQSPNAMMDSIRYIVQRVARENDALFVDLFAEFVALNIPRHNQDLFIRNNKNSHKKDGVHPTVLGYHFIAQVIYQYLKANNLQKKFERIVCLGDSITNGVGAKGGGTCQGENYPSFLYRLLNANE